MGGGAAACRGRTAGLPLGGADDGLARSAGRSDASSRPKAGRVGSRAGAHRAGSGDDLRAGRGPGRSRDDVGRGGLHPCAALPHRGAGMSLAAVMVMVLALAIDAALGWPDRVYARIGHPVTWIGSLIAGLE